MIEIPLTRGKVALIDDADVPLVSRFKWRARRGWGNVWYAVAHTPMIGGKRTSIQMHRLIVGAPKNVKVDHEDFDGLNNTRKNLRIASNRESSIHRRKAVARKGQRTSSKFIGVSLDKRHGLWKCQIRFHGKSRWLGYHKTEEQAAAIYNEAAKKFHKEFAVLNPQ